MRVAIVDESAERAAVIEQGLNEAGIGDTIVISNRFGLLARLQEIGPEVVLIDLENPGRDELEEYFALSRALPRPIVMFVDQSDDEATAAAIDAGVSAYVIDGLSKARIKPILDVAVQRFHAFARLRDELEQARSALASRETIGRAKAVLMARRGIDEPSAYRLLRSQAMASNRRIAEIAESILMADRMMGGEA